MSATDFGCIGHPLIERLLPVLHRSLMDSAGIQDVYRFIDILPEDLPAAIPHLFELMSGFNCEGSFQEAIIPYLTGLDSSAANCGAVDTVFQGIGYHTGFSGFLKECPDLSGQRVLLLGAGRVASMMGAAAAKAGAPVWILARRPEQAQRLAEKLRNIYADCQVHCLGNPGEWQEQIKASTDIGPWVLLNGTPVGHWPVLSGLAFPPELLHHFNFIYDAVYNPVASRLVLAAHSRGIPVQGGLGLFISRALLAEQIWHPAATFSDGLLAAVQKMLTQKILAHFPQTLILNGFMGSGKTTVGEALAQITGLPIIDLDQEVEKSCGRSIPEIFAASGEAVFRDLERQQLKSCLQNQYSKILSVGGGTLLDLEAEQIVRNSPAFILYLDTPLETIRNWLGDGSGRPLLHQKGTTRMQELYQQRLPRYEETADLRVNGSRSPEQVAANIAASLGL